MSINIDDIVVYTGATHEQVAYSHGNDPRGLLFHGRKYVVVGVEVYPWYTNIRLMGVNGKFNSVCFSLTR